MMFVLFLLSLQPTGPTAVPQHNFLHNSMMNENAHPHLTYEIANDCIYLSSNGNVMAILPNRLARRPLLSRDTIETIWLPDSTGGVIYPEIFAANPINHTVYIIGTCGLDGFRNIAVCDAQTGERIDAILTGRRTINLAFSETSNKLYCGNYDDRTINVINGTNNSIINTIQLQGTPRDLVWNSINNEIYCAIRDSNKVEVIDCVTDTIIFSIPLNGSPCLHNTIFNPLSNKVYCVYYVYPPPSRYIAVIDGSTHSVIANIQIQGWPGYNLTVNTTDNKVYCTSYQDDIVNVIDGFGDTLITTVPIGDGPSCITYNPIMNRVYVGNWNGYVDVLDGNTNQVINTIYIEDAAWAITYDSLDNRIFVAGYNRAIVIDCNTNAIIGYLPADDWPQGVFWDPEYNQIWIGNSGSYTIDGYSADGLQHRFNTVVGYTPYAAVLNTNTNKYYSVGHSDRYLSIFNMNSPGQSLMKEVGEEPWDVIVNPLENKIYCANRRSDTITIIDGLTDSIIAEVPADSEPVALAYNQTDNKVYCANLCSANLIVIDGNSNNVLGRISVGNRPIPILWNPIDNKIYVGNSRDSTVTIIDAHADTVITTVRVGAYPWSLIHNPNDDKIYCANFSSDDVTIIDGVTNQVIETIYMWNVARPYTFAYNPVNNKIYCANILGQAVVVIDGTTDSIISNIPILSFPYSLLYNPITNTIFCAWVYTATYPDQDAIAVIDGTSDNILADFSIDSQVWWRGLGSPKKALVLDSINNKVYLAHYKSSKISVIDGMTGIDEITSITPTKSLLRIAPNPFRKKTSIKFSAGHSAENIEFKIYDVTGRLVKQLEVSSSHSPAPGVITWDGRDNSSKKLPSGVYFLKLVTGNYSATEKLLLIR